MKDNTIISAIMNPVRQRVLQYLLLHESGTVSAIRLELSDVPPASLYRHINIMLEAGLITVAEERKIRGTVEKTYRLAAQPPDGTEPKDYPLLFQSGLLSLLASFQQYFQSEQPDPYKDMLTLTTSTLLLTDEEFMELLQKIWALYQEVLGNKPSAGRKQRRITLISSPCEET